MLRMTRQADYGIVLLTYFAHHPPMVAANGRASHSGVYNARDLAAQVHLPEPMVGKILKLLGRAGLLVSTRGVKGGYRLARDPAEISVADIVQAIEGPIAITECTNLDAVNCSIAAMCAVKSNWQTINRVVRDALDRISLEQMAGPISLGRMSSARGDSSRSRADSELSTPSRR